MKVLVSGASGLIGSAVVAELTLDGHEIITLGRTSDPANESIVWNVDKKIGSLKKIDHLDAVIHLSGESIANKRWTEEQKKKISSSRINGTEFLIELLSEANLKPQAFICASAIGYYGDRGNEILDESASPGQGYLASVVAQWEAKANEAEKLGSRVVMIRTGIVLSSYGGALSKQLPLFKYGFGAALSSGRQYQSWIHLEDEVRAIIHSISDERLSGPVNLVSNQPVTNLEFSKSVAKALNKPMLFKVPKQIIEIGLGKEFADELLLFSQRIIPKKLNEAGFEFRFQNLEKALQDLLR